MGFFTSKCKKCRKSIVAPYDLSTGLTWLNHVVAIRPDGFIIVGEYDGYGRVWVDLEKYPGIEHELIPPQNIPAVSIWHHPDYPQDTEDYSTPFSTWHARCWRDAGFPGYKGKSKASNDQGWFINWPVWEKKYADKPPFPVPLWPELTLAKELAEQRNFPATASNQPKPVREANTL